MNEFGICDLSIVPVRSDASDKAEIVTQLLFGDGFHVLEHHSSGRWMKIKVAFDGYEGWIDPKQCQLVDEDYFLKLQNTIPRYAAFGLVKSGAKAWPIVLGSTLPYFHEGKILLGQNVYDFDGHLATYDRETLIKLAFNFLGSPYLWGGKTQFGIDCSGFTQQVFKLSGIRLPRDAKDQVKEGVPIEQSTDFEMGDLAFFQNEAGHVIHVGILLDDDRIIHAHGEVKISKIDAKGVLNDDENGHTHFWHSVRRV